MKRFPPLALVVALTFVSCGQNRQQPQPAPSDLLGPFTATGTISSTGASLFRRGTHVLQMNGRTRFFLESRSLDLGDFAGSEVVVRGELFPNTHESFLPVIRVDEVEDLGPQTPSELQEYSIPVLGLSLTAPAEWKSRMLSEEKALIFRFPDEEKPFVRIALVEEGFPEGMPVRVAGKNGVRVVDEGRSEHRVYVENGEERLLFIFAPKGESSGELRDAFYAMLRTVRFEETEEIEEDEETDEGGIPCGGSAGVLCPEGMFCEVRELSTGIGVCRELKGM